MESFGDTNDEGFRYALGLGTTNLSGTRNPTLLDSSFVRKRNDEIDKIEFLVGDFERRDREAGVGYLTLLKEVRKGKRLPRVNSN